jgi:hypothetical protein
VNAATRIVLWGHCHRVDCLRISDVTEPPKDVSQAGPPLARFVILDWETNAPRIDFLAIPYALKDAARCAQANHSPIWAHALRTGLCP